MNKAKFSIIRLLSNSLMLLTLLCVASCSSGGSQSQNEEESDVPADKTPSTTLEPIKDPCELLSRSDLESIEGFQQASEGRTNAISNDTWRVCDFMVDNRNLSVSLKRYDARMIETKGLESYYQDILKTENEFIKAEAQNAPGDQAIYTYGKTNLPGSPYKYLLQWRYGNHTEGMISINIGSEQNSDSMLKRLVGIAEKLDN